MYDNQVYQLYHYVSGVRTRLPWCMVASGTTVVQDEIRTFYNTRSWVENEIVYNSDEDALYYALTDLDPADWSDDNFELVDTDIAYIGPHDNTRNYLADSFYYDADENKIYRCSTATVGSVSAGDWTEITSSTAVDDAMVLTDSSYETLTSLTFLSYEEVGWFEETYENVDAGTSTRSSYALVDTANMDTFTTSSGTDEVRRLASLPDIFTDVVVGYCGGSSFTFDADSPALADAGLTMPTSVTAAILLSDISDTQTVNNQGVYLCIGGPDYTGTANWTDYIAEIDSLNGGTAYDADTFPLMASFMALINYLGVDGIVLDYRVTTFSSMLTYMTRYQSVVQWCRYAIDTLNTNNSTSLTMGLISHPLGFSQTAYVISDTNATPRDDSLTDVNGVSYAGRERLLIGNWTDTEGDVVNSASDIDFVLVRGYDQVENASTVYGNFDPIVAYEDARSVCPSSIPVCLGMVTGVPDNGDEYLVDDITYSSLTAPSNTLTEYDQYGQNVFESYSVEGICRRFLALDDTLGDSDGFMLNGPYRPVGEATPDVDEVSASTPNTAAAKISLVAGIGTDTDLYLNSADDTTTEE